MKESASISYLHGDERKNLDVQIDKNQQPFNFWADIADAIVGEELKGLEFPGRSSEDKMLSNKDFLEKYRISDVILDIDGKQVRL